MSIRGSFASTFSISGRMFSRSLYVGTMTSARSDTRSALRKKPHEPPERREAQRYQGDGLSRVVRRAVEIELDRLCTGGQLHADERVIRAADFGRLSVHRRVPPGIVVLGDDQRGPLRGR